MSSIPVIFRPSTAAICTEPRMTDQTGEGMVPRRRGNPDTSTSHPVSARPPANGGVLFTVRIGSHGAEVRITEGIVARLAVPGRTDKTFQYAVRRHAASRTMGRRRP